MADMRWQVQEAKQRFSELLRKAQADGPQVVTRHGEEIAVVIDVAEYRKLRSKTAKDLNTLLLNGPKIDLPDEEFDALFERAHDLGEREIPFTDGE